MIIFVKLTLMITIISLNKNNKLLSSTTNTWDSLQHALLVLVKVTRISVTMILFTCRFDTASMFESAYPCVYASICEAVSIKKTTLIGVLASITKPLMLLQMVPEKVGQFWGSALFTSKLFITFGPF